MGNSATPGALGQRPLWQLTLLWTASLFLLPVLLIQGLYTRRTALRLADGAPPNHGLMGDGEVSHKLLGLGDSVIAGTGLQTMSESVIAQVAAELHRQNGATVAWEARGVNGHAIADLLEEVRRNRLSVGDERPDVIIVSIGVNDVTRLTGVLRWQLRVTELVPMLLDACNDSVILLGVPPMEGFTALPQPLRWVLGIRAAMLDKSLRQVSDLMSRVLWVTAGVEFDASHLAEDGYHPNRVACREMAVEIASRLRGLS